jgi:hypothetical protein
LSTVIADFGGPASATSDVVGAGGTVASTGDAATGPASPPPWAPFSSGFLRGGSTFVRELASSFKSVFFSESSLLLGVDVEGSSCFAVICVVGMGLPGRVSAMPQRIRNEKPMTSAHRG